MKRDIPTTDAWLAEEHPDLHHLLRVADGDAEVTCLVDDRIEPPRRTSGDERDDEDGEGDQDLCGTASIRP